MKEKNRNFSAINAKFLDRPLLNLTLLKGEGEGKIPINVKAPGWY